MDNCADEEDMAVGIFGGTFDPIHMGHLRVAEEIRELYSLEKVYFVPGGKPPHKRRQAIATAEERLRMLRSAIRGNAGFSASTIETGREGFSYTIDTLKRFEKRFDDLYFLIGIDAFSEVSTWHRYKELFSRTHFIVMTRPTQSRQPIEKMLPGDVRKEFKKIDETTHRHASGKTICLHDITQIDISSTKIKEYLKNGHSIRYLVPASVEKIIYDRGLYRA